MTSFEKGKKGEEINWEIDLISICPIGKRVEIVEQSVLNR